MYKSRCTCSVSPTLSVSLPQRTLECTKHLSLQIGLNRHLFYTLIYSSSSSRSRVRPRKRNGDVAACFVPCRNGKVWIVLGTWHPKGTKIGGQKSVTSTHKVDERPAGRRRYSSKPDSGRVKGSQLESCHHEGP